MKKLVYYKIEIVVLKNKPEFFDVVVVDAVVVETVVVELLPRLRLKTDVIDELNEPEFGLFIKEVT